jgi:CO/xanthine dehydrogenase Mo-binding subunit
MSDRAKKFKVVNKSVTKKDGMQLALGKPSYVADVMPPNPLIIKMLRSPHAHANIKSIDISAAEKMDGIHCVLCHTNVKRVPHTTAGQGAPEPSPYDTYTFPKKVRYVGDRVAAVAADTAEIAQAALDSIKVEYEVLKPVLSIEEALAPGAPIIHDEEDCYIPIPVPYFPEKNICAKVDMEEGSVDEGMKNAPVTIDDEYETHYAQHTPIEPHICGAYMDPQNRIVIITSTQVPFHARRIAAQALELPVKKIRVIKPRIGGGFGTKQEVLLEDITALMALRTGKPVLWELTRAEEFISRTRHPQKFRIRLGFEKDGTLNTYGMKVISNTGAYGSHALTVMCNCGSKVLPIYRAKNILFDGSTVYTNMPVAGAYRGYGATQAAFAVETAMDEVADMLKMDPIDLRKKNHIKSGETSPVFRHLGEGKEGVEQSIGSCGLGECIELGREEIKWDENWKHHTEKTGRYRRGLGMCTLMQGSSVPEIDMGAASIKMNEDGSFNLLIGATDLGTGSDTVLAQCAAEALETTNDDILVYSSDTDMTPFDVGAYASSTTYLSGFAVKKAADKVKAQIISVAADMMDKPESELTCFEKTVVAEDGTMVTYSQIANFSMYERNQFQIHGVASHITHKSPPPFSAHFTEVEVDTYTGKVKVLSYVAAVDCGTAINPQLSEGQTEGGVLNGISYALTEQYLFDEDGKMTNDSFHDYHIYSMLDSPRIKSIIVPTYEETGPYGAKSVSEICINGPAPAIGNAIYNACGVRLKTLPLTQEKVWKALQDLK